MGSQSARGRRRSRGHQRSGRSASDAAPRALRSAYRLTVRHGSKVERSGFDSLDDAIAALREHAERIRAEEDLPGVRMIRTYDPGQRVKARLEISSGRFLRRSDAGVDVMGDGRLVAYAGGVRRRELEPSERPYDAVGDALR